MTDSEEMEMHFKAVNKILNSLNKSLSEAYEKAWTWDDRPICVTNERKKAEYDRGFRDGYESGMNDGSQDVKQRVDAAEAAAFKNGWEKGYERGCVEVLDVLDRIYRMESNELHECFNIDGYEAVFKIPFSEIVWDLKSYDDKKIEAEMAKQMEAAKLHVGDEVIDCSGNKCIITNIDTNIHVIYPANGKTHKWSKKSHFVKTGAHHDTLTL